MSIENPSLLYLDQPLTEEQKAVARENIGAQAAEYGKGLSSNDYTLAEKNKLGSIAAGAQVNTIDSISVNGVAQSVEEKNVDIEIPVVGIQVGGTDVTPDSNRKVNLEIPSGVQRNGIDLTPDANNKVNVVVPVLGIKLAGSMAVPDSEKVVSIPLAQGPNSGLATTNGLLSSTDKGKIDNMVTTVKMNNTELPKSSGAVNIPLFGGSSNPGVVSSTGSDADKFLKGDGTWGNPTVVHQLSLLEDPTGYPEGYYLCDASSVSQEPITYADFARLYSTGTITVVDRDYVFVINSYEATDSYVTFACNNDGLAFGSKEYNTVTYVWSADPYMFIGVNGVSANGHDLEIDSEGWVNIPLASGTSPTSGPSTGLMSGTDKDKLDAYPAVPSSGTGKFLKDDGSWDTPTGTTYSDYDGSTHGLVPPRPSGSTVTKFLREDGQWEVPAGGGGGSGTVDSVSMGSGSPIGPTNGNVALTVATGGSTPADGIMSGTDKVKLDAYAAVPASGSQTGKFMKDDGTWDDPPSVHKLKYDLDGGYYYLYDMNKPVTGGGYEKVVPSQLATWLASKEHLVLIVGTVGTSETGLPVDVISSSGTISFSGVVRDGNAGMVLGYASFFTANGYLMSETNGNNPLQIRKVASAISLNGGTAVEPNSYGVVSLSALTGVQLAGAQSALTPSSGVVTIPNASAASGSETNGLMTSADKATLDKAVVYSQNYQSGQTDKIIEQMVAVTSDQAIIDFVTNHHADSKGTVFFVVQTIY